MNATAMPHADSERGWPVYMRSVVVLSYFSLILLYPVCHHVVSATLPTAGSRIYVGLAVTVVVVFPTSMIAYTRRSVEALGGEAFWTNVTLYFLTHFLWLFVSVPVVAAASTLGLDGPALAGFNHAVVVLGAAATLYFRSVGAISYPELVVTDARERDGTPVVFGVVFAMTWTHLMQLGSPVGVLLAASSLVCGAVVSAVHRWRPTPN